MWENGLKTVNDTLGHEAGDRLIINTADNIRSVFSGNSYRIGGDEFAVILPDVGKEDFERQVDEVRRQMEQNDISVAIGTSWREVGINLKQMLANQKIAATENVEVFGTEKLHTFVSQRTPEGDLLIMRAHTAARDAMKAICPHLKIGLSLSLHDMQPQRFGRRHAAKEWHAEFGHYLPYIKDDDFLGVQNYTRSRFGFFGQIDLPKGAELTQMSYEFYPEALANVIRTVHKEFKGDIIVTENGIATTDDSRRVEFIRRALAGVQSCIDDGIPVKGYCHWSLLDNFEWQKGFSMTFGLIAVDRKTQTRYPKESLAYLGSFAK